MPAPDDESRPRPDEPTASDSVADWHKPVVTIMPASSAENSPGASPDSGVDYS